MTTIEEIKKRHEWLMSEVTNKYLPNQAEKDRGDLIAMVEELKADNKQIGRLFDEVADLNDQLHVRNRQLQAQLDRVKDKITYIRGIDDDVYAVRLTLDQIEAAIKGEEA